jgi:hypothetical protein
MAFFFRNGPILLLLALQAAVGNAHPLHHVADLRAANETCMCAAHFRCGAPDAAHAHSDGTSPYHDCWRCQICDVTEVVAIHPSQRSSPQESTVVPQPKNLLLSELEAGSRTEAAPLVKPPPARLHCITLPLLN